MNGDDMSRGMNQQNRKSNPPKYNEKHSYSPSSNYSYNYNNGYNSGNSSGFNNQQQHSRGGRRPDRFKSGGGHHSNSNERLLKQNDIIIKLLKEIRDRLPAPPDGSANAADPDFLEQDRDDQNDNTADNQECSDEAMIAVDNQEFTEQNGESYPAEER